MQREIRSYIHPFLQVLLYLLLEEILKVCTFLLQFSRNYKQNKTEKWISVQDHESSINNWIQLDFIQFDSIGFNWILFNWIQLDLNWIQLDLNWIQLDSIHL